jgi:hypothetical protein
MSASTRADAPPTPLPSAPAASRRSEREPSLMVHAARNRAMHSNMQPYNPMLPPPKHTYRLQGADNKTRAVDALIIGVKQRLLRQKLNWLTADLSDGRLPPGYKETKKSLKSARKEYQHWLRTRAHSPAPEQYDALVARLQALVSGGGL